MSILRDNVHSSHQINQPYYITTIFIYLKYYQFKSVYSEISDNHHNTPWVFSHDLGFFDPILGSWVFPEGLGFFLGFFKKTLGFFTFNRNIHYFSGFWLKVKNQ